MHKSAHTYKKSVQPLMSRLDAPAEKGQKFEPFWTAPLHNDGRARLRLQKADQKR